MEHVFKPEQLPSGKLILKHFGDDGTLMDEQHSYGAGDIGIRYDYENEIKVAETYFAKRGLVSRGTYEKVRVAYPDMPEPDATVEDFGKSLLTSVRKQQRQKKVEAERRLAESAESCFPRPSSTNWLRVIAGEKSHLVLFASRDWKAISRELRIPSGRDWLHQFGFDGTLPGPGDSGSVAKGLEVGFEVTGNREAMLNASRRLLIEVNEFTANPPDISQWNGSFRPRRKPKKVPLLAWVTVLPPLIEFLSVLSEAKVKIFNHHQ